MSGNAIVQMFGIPSSLYLELIMAFALPAIFLAAQFVVAVADGVPNINYEQGCRASAAADASLGIVADDQSVNDCMAEERGARDRLTQQWTQFSPNERVHCEREAALGEMPSYVELQSCLQLARETKSMPELKSFIKKSRPSK